MSECCIARCCRGQCSVDLFEATLVPLPLAHSMVTAGDRIVHRSSLRSTETTGVSRLHKKLVDWVKLLKGLSCPAKTRQLN
eukprot:5248906-Amphidinium_carterae.2